MVSFIAINPMADECIIRFFHEAVDCLQHSVVLPFDRNLLVVVIVEMFSRYCSALLSPKYGYDGKTWLVLFQGPAESGWAP
jgi:hypothetical protein